MAALARNSSKTCCMASHILLNDNVSQQSNGTRDKGQIQTLSRSGLLVFNGTFSTNRLYRATGV